MHIHIHTNAACKHVKRNGLNTFQHKPTHIWGQFMLRSSTGGSDDTMCFECLCVNLIRVSVCKGMSILLV